MFKCLPKYKPNYALLCPVVHLLQRVHFGLKKVELGW